MKLSALRNILLWPSKSLNYLSFKLNRVNFSSINTSGLVYVANQGKIEIGHDLKINSGSFKNMIGGDTRSTIIVRKDAFLKLGDNVRISNSAIYCANKIVIGNNVMIGGSCKIWDTDFHPIDPNIRMKNPNEMFKTKPIIINDNVFIGGFSIILKGVEIGENSVIGAGSVVSKNIPAGEIWAGNPAVFIKKVIENENKHL